MHRFEPSRPLETPARVIVVGASSGLGAALVRQLAARGCRVAALARRADELAAVCADLPTVHAYPHDVSDSAAIPALFDQIVSDLDGLDAIYYVAGIQPPVGPDEYDFAKDSAMVQVNLLGAIGWLNLAATRFSRLGRGHIVGISSVSGDRGRAAFPAYHASKGGLSIYLEALRNRLVKRGVRVTTIKPGMMQTRLLANAGKPLWPIAPEAAAQQTLAAVDAGKQVVYIPGRWRWVMLVIMHIPSLIFRRLNI